MTPRLYDLNSVAGVRQIIAALFPLLEPPANADGINSAVNKLPDDLFAGAL